MCIYTSVPMLFGALKGQRALPFLFWLFFHQKISIMLQASSILSWAVVIGLATSWLPPLQDTPLITTVDLSQAIGYWDGGFLTSSLY